MAWSLALPIPPATIYRASSPAPLPRDCLLPHLRRSFPLSLKALGLTGGRGSDATDTPGTRWWAKPTPKESQPLPLLQPGWHPSGEQIFCAANPGYRCAQPRANCFETFGFLLISTITFIHTRSGRLACFRQRECYSDSSMSLLSTYRSVLSLLAVTCWLSPSFAEDDKKPAEGLEFEGSFWNTADSFRLNVDFSKSPAKLHCGRCLKTATRATETRLRDESSLPLR